MKIVNQSANIDRKTLYVMTTGNGTKRLSDCVGQKIEIDCYVIYDRENQDGTIAHVLSIKTKDGDIVGTNSRSFVEGFENAVDVLGSDFTAFSVGQHRSKTGHNYLTCDVSL